MDLSLKHKSLLEEQIAKDLDLLKKYEDRLRVSDNLKDQEQCKQEIARLKSSINGKERELLSLSHPVISPPEQTLDKGMRARELLSNFLKRNNLSKPNFVIALNNIGHEYTYNFLDQWLSGVSHMPREPDFHLAMVSALSQISLEYPINAEEAIEFLALVDYPFHRLAEAEALFDLQEYQSALQRWFPRTSQMRVYAIAERTTVDEVRKIIETQPPRLLYTRSKEGEMNFVGYVFEEEPERGNV